MHIWHGLRLDGLNHGTLALFKAHVRHGTRPNFKLGRLLGKFAWAKKVFSTVPLFKKH